MTPGQTVTVGPVPTGSLCGIKETGTGGAQKVSVSPDTVTVGDETTSVAVKVTNTFPAPPFPDGRGRDRVTPTSRAPSSPARSRSRRTPISPTRSTACPTRQGRIPSRLGPTWSPRSGSKQRRLAVWPSWLWRRSVGRSRCLRRRWCARAGQVRRSAQRGNGVHRRAL